MSKYNKGNVGNIADKEMWDKEILKLWRRRHLLSVEDEKTILNITKKIYLDV